MIDTQKMLKLKKDWQLVNPNAAAEASFLTSSSPPPMLSMHSSHMELYGF